MNRLKFKSLKYFIICAFVISLAHSSFTAIFECFIYSQPLIEMGEYDYASSEFMIPLLANTVISVFVFIIGAYIFYRFTQKAIKEESERQIKEQNLLYSSIAHDLKTPMTSIQGFSSALKDGKIKPEDQEEIIDIIYKKSQYMNELVETLLTYSKLGTESYTLNLSKTNICSLVRELTAVNYSEFENKEITLNIEIPDEAIYLNIDEKEFRRAVSNIIVNAYKHNEIGATVLIKVYTLNSSTYITVADDGKEISKEFAETMFNPFVCGDSSRTSGKGNGLGLAISSKIIEKHNGSLYLNNDIDGYTKGFVIRII